MDDIKRIEEMAKIIENVLNSRMAIGNLSQFIAVELLKYYQPKLPENSVVLSREEYEKSLQEKYEQGKFDIQCDLEKHDKYLLTKRKYAEIMREGQCITELINKAKKQGGKEAVEKFTKDLLSVWDDLEKWSEKYYEPHSGITPAHIKEYAKQFGVEIKEN